MDKLKKQAKKYKVRTTYDKNGKRVPRKASAIKNDIKKKKSKKTSRFGVIARQSDGHFREEHPASGLKVNPNDNTKWVWLPVTWNCCEKCGMYHSNRKIPASFWKREWGPPSSNVKAGVIIVRGNQLLMTQSYHDKFGFPKGAVDDGENIVQAASRELYEETGISVKPSLLGSRNPLRVVSGRNVFHMFVYNVPPSFRIRSFPLDDTEITTFGWVNVNQASSLKLSNAMKAILRAYQKSVSRNWGNSSSSAFPPSRRQSAFPQKKTGADSGNWRRRFGKKNVNINTPKADLVVIAKKLKIKKYYDKNKKQLLHEILKF